MPEPTPVGRISLRDVARAVGVSHVTVSLALRDDPRVSATRRAEVREAAQRLGYQPDPMLTSLSAYRQGKRAVAIRSAVAWLNQWPNPRDLRRHHEFDNYWLGAHEVAIRLGYHLEEFVLDKKMLGPRLQKIFQTRNIRGILIPPHSAGFALPSFDWELFSVVRFGASVPRPRTHIVTNDQTKCAAMAFTRVYERGYRRIGYISSLAFERNTKGNFRAGYLSSESECVQTQDYLPPLYLEETTGAAEVSQLLEWMRTVRPDAIITTLITLDRLLQKAGLSVPHDVAVATTSLADGQFDSGVDQNSIEIGRVAMSTLAGLIQLNERGIPRYCRRILVEGQWVDGHSLPWRSAVATR